jgi:hypothetical protein
MRIAAFRVVAVLISIMAGLGISEQGGMNPDAAGIWDEFVAALKKGEVTADRFRPYYPELEKPLLGYLAEMRGKASWRNSRTTRPQSG